MKPHPSINTQYEGRAYGLDFAVMLTGDLTGMVAFMRLPPSHPLYNQEPDKADEILPDGVEIVNARFGASGNREDYDRNSYWMAFGYEIESFGDGVAKAEDIASRLVHTACPVEAKGATVGPAWEDMA